MDIKNEKILLKEEMNKDDIIRKLTFLKKIEFKVILVMTVTVVVFLISTIVAFETIHSLHKENTKLIFKNASMEANERYKDKEGLARQKFFEIIVEFSEAKPSNRNIRRYEEYFEAFWKYGRTQRHLPIEFWALWVATETDFRFKNTSPNSHGCWGLMQVQWATGKQYAEYLGIKLKRPEELNDPEINVRVGVAIIMDYMERFNYNQEHYVKAYNMGPTITEKLLKGNKSQDKHGRNYWKRWMSRHKRIEKLLNVKLIIDKEDIKVINLKQGDKK